MAKGKVSGDAVRCSFCAKSATEVGTVIAGPSAYICDECVALCGDILLERARG